MAVITLHKHIGMGNEELFKPKADAGKRTNGYKLATNKFRLRVRATIRASA